MIEICIGSACHLKGSYEVIKEVKDLLEEFHLTGQVELKSSFCLGACGEGVSVRINGDKIYSLKKEETRAFFIREVVKANDEIH
ncbi:MAG: NAD(P)H-dependent oxidoreductase subunit E [Vallitaleaceae bacterium]|nr:NAD(P)H-dependent oxidoreductase subunit E [Vallitaleaceae bacterium]